MSKIIGVETAFPEHRYGQQEVMGILKKAWPTHEAVLERLVTTSGVESRHTVLPLETYAGLGGFEKRNKVFIDSMVTTLAKAVKGLQEKTGFDWKDLAIITSTTVTGVAVPSLDARLMNLLPIPTDIVRNPLFGIGCLGGIAGLNRTRDLLKAYPTKLALMVASEACSLTFQFDDVTMSNMVACSLFGDGAAAVLMAGEDHPLSREGKLTIMDSMSSFYPNTERIMGWDMVDSGFKVVLSGNVPGIVEEHLRDDADKFLARSGLGLEKIENLISHPGGPKVLKAVAATLGKDESLLRHSWEGLRENGNMSSVSVLDVMQRSLEQGSLKPGYALGLAMGPAFNAELSLFKVGD